MRVPLGKWTPDLAPMLVQQGLMVATNVVPVSGGYGPIGALTNIDSQVLSAAPRGIVTGVLDDGQNFFFAATETTIERFQEVGGTASWNDVSRTSPAYTIIGQRRWNLVQFGQNIIATSYVNETQGFDLARDTEFSDVGAACPRAAHATVSENFLVLGDLVDAVLGVNHNAIGWSAIGNPYGWPVPGTDTATAVLSGQQVFEGDGGWVQGLVSGSEVLAVFQERSIWRGDFVGGDVVWQFNRVEANHGLLIKDATVSFGRSVFYISEDGFRIFDYTGSQNIGKDVVNDFFFNDYDNSFPDSVTVRRDPDQTRIFVSYPGAGNTDGRPNKILIWDYELDSWSVIEAEHWELSDAGTITASLDAPATAGDPDELEDPPQDEESFDDRPSVSGSVQIGAFDSTFRLSQFNGVGLAGTLETGDIEVNPGQRSTVTAVRPIVDGEETTVQVAPLDRRFDTVSFSEAATMAPDGNCYLRSDGRYHRFRCNLDPYFTEAVAFDITARASGTR